MVQWELDDATRPTTRRSRIIKVNDKGTQQKVDISGYKNEKPEEIWNTQPFGFSSHPPKDSDGIIDQMGSRSDRTFYRDAGHEKYRPKRTPEGGTVLFDHTGNIIRVFPEHSDVVNKEKINIRIGKGYKTGTEDSGGEEAEGGSEEDTSEDDESEEDEKTISIVLDGDKITLEYDGNKVEIEDGKITATATERFAGGVGGGKWVVAKSGRVDLGVSGPDEEAPNKVATEAGLSSVVFAVI
jgi:hypothetical protein